ncbi:MAG: ABC transporter permease subunit, partial [Phycisphaerales bacterium]|nr:ABC transporter permease subunit [Phycisphaerales bacterium]
VLGNLFGRLFFVLALLFASLPLFALTQFFGGVPSETVFMSYLIAASAALFVGTTAIALSMSRLVGRRAVFAFYVSVVSYLAVTGAIDAGLRGAGLGAGPAGNGVTWMTAINPFLSMRALLSPTSYPTAPLGSFTGLRAMFFEGPISTFTLITVIGSIALILASTLTVRTGGLQSIGRGRIRLRKKPAGVEHRAPRAVWNNPIAWREAAARNATAARIAARWIFVVAGGVFGVALIWLFHVGTLDGGNFRLAILSTIWGEVAVVTLVAINMAATAVSREREDGTLDILLTTPITPWAYLSGKMRGLIAYLLPLLAVPMGTLLLASLYVLLDGLGREGGVMINTPAASRIQPGMQVPVLLPESGLLAPFVLVPFLAFCVMIGLQWSLKSKGTIGSVVVTVAVVGAISGVVGLCGWKSGSSIDVAGPFLAGLSPASAVFAYIHPEAALDSTIRGSNGFDGARIALGIGSAVAAIGYIGIVYGIQTSMVRNFDFTVRKLAGTG